MDKNKMAAKAFKNQTYLSGFGMVASLDCFINRKGKKIIFFCMKLSRLVVKLVQFSNG
jgi:hypothetical protein